MIEYVTLPYLPTDGPPSYLIYKSALPERLASKIVEHIDLHFPTMFRANTSTWFVPLLLSLILLASTQGVVEPDKVTLKIKPGRSKMLKKKITIPDIPAMVDICLVQDLTGSFDNDLTFIKEKASDITAIGDTSDARFGLVGFQDYPGSGGAAADVPYKLFTALTGDKTVFENAVQALEAPPGAGGDSFEAQYDAIVKSVAAEGGCGYRPDPATRIMIVATDDGCKKPSDNPLYQNDEASTIAALKAAGVIVIGLVQNDAGSAAKDCIMPLVQATGGVLKEIKDGSFTIAEDIKNAIKALTFDVTPALLPLDTCKGVEVTFDPPTVKNLKSGDMAEFKETVKLMKWVKRKHVLNCKVAFEPAGTQELTIKIKKRFGCRHKKCDWHKCLRCDWKYGKCVYKCPRWKKYCKWGKCVRCIHHWHCGKGKKCHGGRCKHYGRRHHGHHRRYRRHN